MLDPLDLEKKRALWCQPFPVSLILLVVIGAQRSGLQQNRT